MPTPTYTPLANITLGSSAASVTFSSINTSLYRDLILVINAKHASGNNMLKFRLNSDTGSNYNAVFMEGNGSSATSGSYSSADYFGLNYNYNNINTTGGVYILNIMDYSATDKHKTILARGNSSEQETAGVAASWASTSAVTSILCYLNSGSYAAGSSFALYGIAA
jgi:hypothetical protein